MRRSPLECRSGIAPREGGHFTDELTRRAEPDRNGLGAGLIEGAAQPLGRLKAGFRIQQHVEVGLAEPGQVRGACTQGRDDIDVDLQLPQDLPDRNQVVPMPESERTRPEDVAAGTHTRLAGRPLESFRRRVGRGHGPHDLIERLGGAPVFLFLVGRKLEGHHWYRQAERARESARVVLNQFGGARGADQHGRRLEPFIGLAHGALKKARRIAAQIPRLEGRIGHGRAARQPLDHGEQQIGVGIALRCVQHVVHVLHGRRDPHGAHMGRSFVGPDGELHGYATSRVRRTSGRANSSARSAAWLNP
jgi:hypothetical protein